MSQRVDAKGPQAIEINLLNIKRRGFQNDLILIVMLQAIGIFSVPTIGRATRRFYISHSPWFRAKDPQEGGGMEGPCPDLHVIGLLNNTTLIRPESLQ
jgi:hypothetical protein